MHLSGLFGALSGQGSGQLHKHKNDHGTSARTPGNLLMMFMVELQQLLLQGFSGSAQGSSFECWTYVPIQGFGCNIQCRAATQM